ncbi:MAG: ABC transporter permease [Ginsengibacter sp.]
MWIYNVKLALRNLWRHKTFSFINIMGFTLSLASCIIIGLYVFSELSFDHFNSHHDNLYRVNKMANVKDKNTRHDALTPGLLAPSLQMEIPGVVAVTRFRPWFSEMLVSSAAVKLKLKDVSYADASILQMFDFPLLKGDRKTALAEPNTAVITATTAHQYFGDDDPIGKILTTLNDMPVKVTGVLKDIPYNSSIQFPMLISWSTLTSGVNANNFSWLNSWNAQVSFTFIQLQQHANILQTGNKISSLLHAHFPEKEFEYKTYLQSLNEIHLRSGGILYADQFLTGSNAIVYTLILVAIFILLIASFNFINITSAGAIGRAKETGVQKVLGAKPCQIFWKFLSESFVLCMFSFLLSCFMVFLLLPLFNHVANSSLSVSLFMRPVSILALVSLLLLISIISALYPAILLSGIKTTDIFRNVIKTGKGAWLRKSLVTVQFALSILLIIATVVVNKQLRYLTNKDLGFDKEQVLVLPVANTNLVANSGAFLNDLKKYPGIQTVSATNNIPGQVFNGYGIIPEGHNLVEHLMASVMEADANFASVYHIKLAQGRFFSSQLPTDTTNSIVINEAMARYLNWKSPVGKKLEIYEETKGQVVGVIKDFNFATLRESVQPLAIMLRNNPQYFSLKIKARDIPETLGYIKRAWKKFEPNYPFDYFFLDEKMNRYYQSDIRLLNVLTIFSGLAICIACMGLFGLSIYAARQRTKEIGIRKVLGASIARLILLLSEDFLKLILMAAVIAFPISWWAMNTWLQHFAYRINISWTVFIIAGIVSFLIALCTLSFQAIKTAMANPVKSLRTD